MKFVYNEVHLHGEDGQRTLCRIFKSVDSKVFTRVQVEIATLISLKINFPATTQYDLTWARNDDMLGGI